MEAQSNRSANLKFAYEFRLHQHYKYARFFYIEEAQTISQSQETGKTTSGYICPNMSCQRTFTRPLKTINIGISEKQYDACPFCLSEVSGASKVELHKLPKEHKPSVDEKEPNSSDQNIKEPGCRNYFGFLSERSSKDQIPDECITCRQIVQCMLRKTQT